MTPATITTTEQLAAAVSETRSARLRIVEAVLAGGEANAGDLKILSGVRAALEAAPPAQPSGDGAATAPRLIHHKDRPVVMDLSYEIGEIEKDLVFLQEGEERLLALLERLHESFARELRACREFLAAAGRRGEPRFSCFVGDRDGTLNAYSGRYWSSVQSACNAVLLARFARRSCRRALILTSAPLRDGGLVDVTVLPAGVFALAGSKGREALDEDGRVHCTRLSARDRRVLATLRERLTDLLSRQEFEVFALIGSGFQVKFGQCTVAYQDVYGSVEAGDSQRFRASVAEAVEAVDPGGRALRIEDTGRDLEIMLAVASDDGGLRAFDKGDGLRFLHRELALPLEGGDSLVCGDTSSDLPMLEAAADLAGQGTTSAVFVTRDAGLREAVRERCPRSCFVGASDVLVAALGGIGP